MCDSSKTSCGPADTLRGRTEAKRSDESQVAGHRLGANAAANHPGQRPQGSLRAALAATLERTQSVLETRSAKELHFSWQDERRATLGCDDPANVQDGSRTSSYQEAGYATYPEAFFRDGATRSRSRSDGNQQAARTQQLYDNHDLFTLPQATLGFNTQPDRLAPGSAVSKVDRSIASVTIGTVAEEQILEATRRKELVGVSESASDYTAELTVHSIIKRFTPAFIAKHRETTASQVESTLARLGFCRTAPLGGRTFTCKTCESQVSMYNSCGDRHCPQCSGARRGDWLDKAAKLLLPDVTYFQVVFTLPDKLSSLVLGNRRSLYSTLMRVAAESLEQALATECGMQSASLVVLHTWNQRLGHHPHVHALVPGSGPSLDGKRWVAHRMTKRTRSKPARPFLVDNKRLSAAFRQRFLRQLKSLHRRGKLEIGETVAELADPKAWNTFIDSLLERDWCVFIEPPPTTESTPDQVLKYLARYMTGGPISDQRLVSCENGIVTFKARPGDKQKSKQQIDVEQSGVEFVRNWTLHILPKGFTKSRGYGGYSSRNRTAFIALCQQLKPPQLTPTEEVKEASQPNDAPFTTEETRCPICLSCQQSDGREQSMALTGSTFRPSWRDLFYGPDHPQWFES